MHKKLNEVLCRRNAWYLYLCDVPRDGYSEGMGPTEFLHGGGDEPCSMACNVQDVLGADRVYDRSV